MTDPDAAPDLWQASDRAQLVAELRRLEARLAVSESLPRHLRAAVRERAAVVDHRVRARLAPPAPAPEAVSTPTTDDLGTLLEFARAEDARVFGRHPDAPTTRAVAAWDRVARGVVAAEEAALAARRRWRS